MLRLDDYAKRLWISSLFVALLTALVMAIVTPTRVARAQEASRDAGATATVTLVFFWGLGCSHCEEAKPFLDALEKHEPQLHVERVEVRQDAEGRLAMTESVARTLKAVSGAVLTAFGALFLIAPDLLLIR